MIQSPRNETLAEALYRGIENNQYLNEIYDGLLHDYTLKLFHLQQPAISPDLRSALRFSDLLSKSTYAESADRDRLWGQEIITLLHILYPDDPKVQYYLGAVLSAVGNYRGLEAGGADNFHSADLLDKIYYEYDKSIHLIPGKEDDYFFHDQKAVYDKLGERFFSYSGPTSMGKSFVVQTYIQQQIINGSTENYAILVPTKAIINDVKSCFIKNLQHELTARNYRIVSAVGDLVLTQDHHFIFIMTPERMLHLLIERGDIQLNFLFIDEAHKISAKGGRSTYYYQVLTRLQEMHRMPTVIFASPNIPNPEVYLNMLPGYHSDKSHRLASRFAPVCQFKFFVDVISGEVFYHNDFRKKLKKISSIPTDTTLANIVSCVGENQQNLVYCSSKSKVMEYAIDYARNLLPLHNPELDALATEIRTAIHKEYYLADLIEKGVAFHVGYLPASIRLRIEQSFEKGELRTIFCTSTLVEGVNLPADNLFITSYKDGQSNMDEVEFRNLVGRVGRIKYNLFGNVFLVRIDEELRPNHFSDLLKNDIPSQQLSIDVLRSNPKYMRTLVSDLAKGDIEMTQCHELSTERDFDALRKFALIYTRDVATGRSTAVRTAFEQFVDQDTLRKIRQHFPVEKTSDDISLSFDQVTSLHEYVQNGSHYPDLTGDNDDVDFDELVHFLNDLSRIFKWEKYEKETIGRKSWNKPDAVIRWYAAILLRWIRGNGLSSIIYHAIQYKQKHPDTGVWLGRVKVADVYVDCKEHNNVIIAETLGVIENVLLFNISNYFRKFSSEYKAVNNCPDGFKNDWYEYVEYGTTNPEVMELQKIGFSREASSYIEAPRNRQKYIVCDDNGLHIKRSLLECGDLGVETEAKDIQYNMPEIFVD